jgi:hypothetical protein
MLRPAPLANPDQRRGNSHFQPELSLLIAGWKRFVSDPQEAFRLSGIIRV